MPQMDRVSLNGRDIYLATGRISQTVNVCTEANIRGQYQWIIRLAPSDHFVSVDDIYRRVTVDDVINWLTRERSGQIERSPSGVDIEAPTEDSSEPAPSVVPQTVLDPGDSLWIERAMKITEICIDELVREFLDFPYLHRVEHSIHTRLYSILRDQPHFDRHFPLAEGGMLTQPIHKEWPETIPRQEKGNRRGNFDLAILSPGRLKTCTLEDFSKGQLAPPIVIEMGMNYKEGHLSHDAEKLLNSRVPHGYLVHLVRERDHEKTIDQTIERLHSEASIKVAFARVQGGQKFLKLLGDPCIHPV